MGDSQREGIYRIEINTGEEMEIVGGTKCPTAISLDYSTRDLYWTQHCNYELKTSKMDGSNIRTLSSGLNQMFAYGASAYNNHIFWTQSNSNYSIECFERRTERHHRIYTLSGTGIFWDLEIVHPSLQPSSKPL